MTTDNAFAILFLNHNIFMVIISGRAAKAPAGCLATSAVGGGTTGGGAQRKRTTAETFRPWVGVCSGQFECSSSFLYTHILK